MQELIFNILIFTIVTSVLKCLIIKEEYKQYFQFFCGLIMVLIVITPVIKFFDKDTGFYNILNEHIYSSELKNSVSELENVEGDLKKSVLSQCEKKIEKQISDMACKYNVKCNSVKVKTKTKGDELRVVSVVVNTGTDAVAAYSNTEKRAVRLSKNEKKLKNDICSNYMLKKEEVQIWK